MRNIILALLLCANGYAIGQNTGQDPAKAGSPDCSNAVGSGQVGETTPPQLTFCPEPTYPPKERKAGHEGTVIVLLHVDEDGATHDFTVSRSLSPDFDAAALDAVKAWKFIPATRNGKPIPAQIGVQVSFHLFTGPKGR